MEVTSSHFYIEQNYDFLTIDGETHTGSESIYQEVPSYFTVSFTSDESETCTGFILDWRCGFIYDNARNMAIGDFSLTYKLCT